MTVVLYASPTCNLESPCRFRSTELDFASLVPDSLYWLDHGLPGDEMELDCHPSWDLLCPDCPTTAQCVYTLDGNGGYDAFWAITPEQKKYCSGNPVEIVNLHKFSFLFKINL